MSTLKSVRKKVKDYRGLYWIFHMIIITPLFIYGYWKQNTSVLILASALLIEYFIVTACLFDVPTEKETRQERKIRNLKKSLRLSRNCAHCHSCKHMTCPVPNSANKNQKNWNTFQRTRMVLLSETKECSDCDNQCHFIDNEEPCKSCGKEFSHWKKFPRGD